MPLFKKPQPSWREDVAAPGTFRSILKYDPNKFKHPSHGWVEAFKSEFGMTDEDFQGKAKRPGGDQPVRLEQPIALAREQIDAFRNMLGGDNVAADDYSRVRYGHGKALEENLDLRKGIARKVPDLVLHPRDKEDVKKIVEYCNQQRIALVTYGAGSGVVLGTRADRGGVALALRTHMNKLISINELNKTCVVQPGMMGPDYEDALQHAPERFGTKLAYTCGHFPQSFEISTVGGWIAALGSGQASSYYGDAYHIVHSQEYVTPAGVIKTNDIPGTATGPRVNDILKGNEGTYGVLVEATMKVFKHMPDNRQRFAFMFPSWEAAVDASRAVAQGEFGMPAVFRISDPEETELGLKLKGFDGGLFGKLLVSRGFQPMRRSLCIGTVEGEKSFAANVKKQIAKIARAHGAMSLTGVATRQWEHGRYSDVHMRDDLLDHGILIDTLETGVTWDNVLHLHRAVREFVKKRPRTFCMTHASHFYPQGTNLYFIFIARPEHEEEFFEFRAGIISKIVENGGSVSHHHGVGRLFAPWIERHLGKEQMAVLRALKRHFDPNDIMNPGGALGLS
ncbi:MAG: FAD-binding oxidoreductase [Deltaproteobacteria bacterium]|nr:FAD-binding oxidoreductase [Deltaproteobacteria bacterium]